MKSFKVIVTGGGTGGHIYPALAVANKLIDHQHEVLYVSRNGALEEELAQKQHINFQAINITSFERKLSLKNLYYPYVFIKAYQQAITIIETFKPNIIFATGGYTIAPTLFAAYYKKIPYVIHEPDSHLGLANRLFSFGAWAITLGMEACAHELPNYQNKIHLTGNPISQSFYNTYDRATVAQQLGLKSNFKTLVITGGSQGAMAINEVICAIIEKLLTNFVDLQIIHQTGSKNYDLVRNKLSANLLNNDRYLIQPYFDDLAQIYALADLAICRSGAMTISELTVSGLPAIFIPYPYAAQNHQFFNADYLRDRQASLLINQSDLNADYLYTTIAELFNDMAKLNVLKTNMKNLAKLNSANEIIKILELLAS